MALSVANPFMTVLMLYSGFLILKDEINPPFHMFQYMSPWFYSFAGNMKNMFEGIGKQCEFKINETSIDALGKAMHKVPIDKEEVLWLRVTTYVIFSIHCGLV